MPAFPKPKFVFNFDLQDQLDFLNAHKAKRRIPEKSDSELLIASWNIANLGLQKRWEQHYLLIAQIVEWFDIIAIQEVNNKLGALRKALVSAEQIVAN